VRHHKFCENQGDPHSAPRFGFLYGFVGWTFHPSEWHIDWEYVHAPFKTWEMVLCEGLTGVVSFGEQYFWYRTWGFQAGECKYQEVLDTASLAFPEFLCPLAVFDASLQRL
jgi:hypothetical protein